MRMVGTGAATFVQRKQLLVCVVIPRLAIGTHSISAACHQVKNAPVKMKILFVKNLLHKSLANLVCYA